MAERTKKKKKGIQLILLLCVILALGAVYLLVDRRQTGKEDRQKAQEEELDLYETRITRVKRVRLENEYYDMTLIKDEEEDLWHREGREDFEVSHRRMTAVLSAVMKITASNRVAETVENLAEYGLTDPIARVTVESEDGNISFVVGGRAPMIDTFYFMVEGDPALYTVNSEYYYAFHRTENQMREVEKIEVPGASAIRRVRVDRPDGVEIDFLYDPETDSGRFVRPYASPQKTDGASAQNFKKLFQDFSLEEYQGQEELDLAEYGLKDPAARIRVNWQNTEEGSEGEVDLKVGALTEDGEYYYVQLAGSGRVYTMEEKLVRPMAEAVPFSYIQKAVLREEDGEITKITAERDGKHIEVDKENLPALREALAGIKLEGDLMEEDSREKGDLVFRLNLSTEAGERELTFYAYDEKHFYRLEDGEGNSFLTGKRETDALAALLEE